MLRGSQTTVADADIRLITGKQRSGKTNTLIASPVDDYMDKMTALVSPNGEPIIAKSLTKEDKNYLRMMDVDYGVHQYCKVFSDDLKTSKIIKMPSDYCVLSPVKIFANFHLYGINYVPISLADVLQYANTEMFNDAWILSSESVMADARNSMEMGGKLVVQWGASTGKRNAHLCFDVQYNTMIDVRIRQFTTMRIECSYEKARQLITCEINKAGEPPKSVTYKASYYWRFYDTNEIIAIPQEKIDKALAKIYAGQR